MSDNRAKTILLVENEALIALAETKLLQRHGYTVVNAYSGEKAIRAVENQPEIDLLLTDINLGKEIDGIQAAERILGQRNIPVIFLTAYPESEVARRATRIASYGYIAKDGGDLALIHSIRTAFHLPFPGEMPTRLSSQYESAVSLSE